MSKSLTNSSASLTVTILSSSKIFLFPTKKTLTSGLEFDFNSLSQVSIELKLLRLYFLYKI